MGAFGLDLLFGGFALLFVAIVVSVVFVGLSDISFEEDMTDAEAEQLGTWIWGVWALAYLVATWIQNASGASLGKRIVGIRIVTEDFEPPGMGTGVGRTFAAWLSWPLFGLGFLWATWDDRGQTWHDKMAGTYVVRDGWDPAAPPTAIGTSLH